MKNGIKLLLVYLTAVAVMAIYIVTTSHNGTESYASVERPKEGYVTIRQNKELKAVVNGDTIPFLAASNKRCDNLYKYGHCIGMGNIVGASGVYYIYVKNDNYRLITVDQMLAEKK